MCRAPWRAAVRRYELRAAAAMPIRFQGEVRAAFVVYAATPGVFQAQEISLLEEAVADISFALEHLETERQRQDAEERIAHLAHHDALTQLPNRALLTDLLHQAMVQSRCDRSRLAVCYLDLDDFKSLNDARGHAQGDRILVEVARRLRRCMRASDTVARLGAMSSSCCWGIWPTWRSASRPWVGCVLFWKRRFAWPAKHWR
ncbi:MAG: diguanylate cyclase [Candidatus Competibacteraceae bacterium]|nr:diguanylate cyclase [Candidatus Competibacteraceae bacterium]